LDGDQVLEKWTELHGQASVKDMYNNCDFLFFEYDHDQDNHLSFEEADSFLADFSHASNRSKEDLFIVCDVDGDRLLSQHEFRSAYLMYEMMLLDFLRVEEFLELRPQYKNQRGRGRRKQNSDPNSHKKSSRSDEWVGKDVEVRWMYNTVRKKYRWEPAKVEERNRDGTYRVFFENDAYPEDGIPESHLRLPSAGTLRIVLIAPPNSGEEVQAAHLKRKYGIVHLKFEDILHDAINLSTPTNTHNYSEGTFNTAPKQIVEVDDMIDMIQMKVESTPDCANKGFLITDFPTSAIQARELDNMLGALAITHALHLKVPSRIFKQRMAQSVRDPTKFPIGVSSHQTTPEGRRVVDSDKMAIAELQRFESTLGPVLKFYENKGLVREVHATQDDDEIWTRVQEALLRNETEEEEYRNRKAVEREAGSNDLPELERHPTFPKLLPLDGEVEPTGVCERASCAIQ